MCLGGGQPEPDINKPNYEPSDMDKHFELTMNKDGKKTTLQKQEEEAQKQTKPTSSSPGLRMWNEHT